MRGSNLNSLVRFLRKGPYRSKADGDFARMRAAETKRRRKRIEALELVASGVLQPTKATPHSGRILRLS